MLKLMYSTWSQGPSPSPTHPDQGFSLTNGKWALPHSTVYKPLTDVRIEVHCWTIHLEGSDLLGTEVVGWPTTSTSLPTSTPGSTLTSAPPLVRVQLQAPRCVSLLSLSLRSSLGSRFTSIPLGRSQLDLTLADPHSWDPTMVSGLGIRLH
jgi:hypothetical protein